METIETVQGKISSVHLNGMDCTFAYERGAYRHQVVCITNEGSRQRRTVMISGPLSWKAVSDRFAEYRQRYSA